MIRERDFLLPGAPSFDIFKLIKNKSHKNSLKTLLKLEIKEINQSDSTLIGF